MIKAVLFDFGGVLTEGGKGGSIRGTFAAAYGISPADVQLDHSVEACFLGAQSVQGMVDATNRLNPTCPPAPVAAFTDDAIFLARCTVVYDLAARLRTAGLVTGVLSNVFKVVAEVLKEKGFYDDFAPLLLSCYCGLKKPDPAIYHLALDKLGLPPSEVLFIDDKDDFLQPAKELGMHTVLAVSPEQIVADITTCLEQENGIQL